MSMKRIVLLLVFVCASISSGFARRGRVESLPVPIVAPVVEKIADQFRDVDMLVKKAQRDAEHVHRAAQRDKQEIEGRMRRRQSRLERRRQEAGLHLALGDFDVPAMSTALPLQVCRCSARDVRLVEPDLWRCDPLSTGVPLHRVAVWERATVTRSST